MKRTIRPAVFRIIAFMLGTSAVVWPASHAQAQDSLAVRAAVAPPNVVWLDTLDLSTWQQRRQRPRARLSLRGKPITMNGVVYPRGVGTLTINEFLVDVKGEAERFMAMVGIDDEMKTGRGSVNFEVWADDKLVASSGVIRAGDAPKLLVADLRGARIVQLITDDGQDTSNDDNADWGGAMFVMKTGTSARPEPYTLPPDGPAEISRATKAEPSINGPRITGATPGRPFLFRIPATGDGPLTFAAKNLPAGVTLDANTGIISGSLAHAGTTVVALSVRGAKGVATRDLTIVGGADKLALTPPLGWNSWNAWGTGVDAEKVRRSADAMETSGLAGHGFQYVNIDDGWEGTRRPDGELPADSTKFPDMKALGDYIHAKGLKFGIYSSPGPRTCGGKAGSYQHELQDARTWARWGVDLLKHDYCSYESIKPGFALETLQAPYRVMRQALDSLDRDVVYSVGNYGYGEAWKWAADVGGELWRTTGDLIDSWSNLESVGFRQAGREQYAGPGRWNDTDMLVVGNVGLGPALHPTRLTQNEQVLHITLWAMQAAPLLIGADMSQLDAFTTALLTNDEVLDVDQDMLGKAGGRVWKEEKLEVWARTLSDGTTAVALFNRGLKPYDVTARWSDIGVRGAQPVRDLWRRKDLGVFSDSFRATVPRHGAVMLKVGSPSVGTSTSPEPTQTRAVRQVRATSNPILSDGVDYTTDPAPLVVGGKLYLLTGRDTAKQGVNDFMMPEWQMLETSGDPKSGKWTHHPHFLKPDDVFKWATPGRAYAAQIVQGVDKRFYLYAPVMQAGSTNKDKFAIGVAVSKSPTGPWTDAHPAGPVVSQSYPIANDIQNIDPTVLVDQDKRVYLYWGTFGKLKGVELEQDMVTFKGTPIDVTTLTGFFEAPWLFKRNGTYYMAYAANKAGPDSECTEAIYYACIAYGTSSSPLGPWTYRGVMLDPVSSTTSHPGIVQYNGKWYLAYHTADAKDGGHFRRSVAIDEVQWDDAVSPARIRKVVPTGGAPFDATPIANIASHARVTASNAPVPVQYWLRALNDGKVRVNPLPPDMWATWSRNNPSQQWSMYQWETPVTLNASSIWFWGDRPAGSGVGVAPPKSWRLEYWTGSSWSAVNTTSPYTSIVGAFNRIDFTPVTTRCLRAVFDASTDDKTHAAVAAQEWQAFSTQVRAPLRQSVKGAASANCE